MKSKYKKISTPTFFFLEKKKTSQLQLVTKSEILKGVSNKLSISELIPFTKNKIY